MTPSFALDLQGPTLEHVLVGFMLVVSLLLVAIAVERSLSLMRFKKALAGAEGVVAEARDGSIRQAMKAGASLESPVAEVLRPGLERGAGVVKGDASRAMHRELKRLGGALRARYWILATAGALMPFVGLFGTVLGVMAAFQAIGETGQGGFAVVSVGISQALVATAVGIAVALEGVVLFNVLQNMAAALMRELALLVDEIVELVDAEGGDRAGTAGR